MGQRGGGKPGYCVAVGVFTKLPRPRSLLPPSSSPLLPPYLPQAEPIAGKLRRFGLLQPGFNLSALPSEHQAALALAVRVGNRLLDAGTLYGFEYEWASGWQVTTRSWGVYGHGECCV